MGLADWYKLPKCGMLLVSITAMHCEQERRRRAALLFYID